MMFASTASAAVVVGGADGWSFSTDGQVNIFGLYQTQDDISADVNNPFLGATEQEGFRLKSGFLPACLAFNIKAPTMGGLDMGARVGFYPEPANANNKNTFDGQIDLREVFFTVDGSFGQVLAGKALSLFLGQNLLTEQTLLGAGRMAGNLNANVGPTLGRIGYGYVYPNFNAQVRYTTPSMAGVKFAIGIYDPSAINGSAIDDNANGAIDAGDTAGAAFGETKMPRFESELSYAGTFGDGNTLKLYFNNMWQEAENAAGDDVTAWGIGGGAVVGLGAFELSASGFTGEALGRSIMLDTEALDPTGEEREGWGYIVQALYTFGQNKVGISYGGNEFDETDFEKTARDAGGLAEVESQYQLTGMFTHDLNANLKLVAEVSLIELEWFNGDDWKVEQFNLGAFFLW
ncbi:MAG: histidine kinase [Syntrophotaleaceae bacterium]